MKLEWLDKLITHPAKWDDWRGRKNKLRATWVTDGVLAVKRSACDVEQVALAEEDKHKTFPGVSGEKVIAIIDALPAYGFKARWVGQWEGAVETYVTIGDPDSASFYLSRLRLAHLLCEFDAATWFDGRDERKQPYSLRMTRGDEIVGILMPIDTKNRHSHPPEEIRETYMSVFA